jgi:3D (Asp-Asp-Asp) domain-containing protein
MPRRRSSFRFRATLFLTVLVVLGGCYLRDLGWGRPRPAGGQDPREVTMEVTGYCKCGSCCGWKRNWYFRPVIASGPSKGKPKKVGVTASGTKARPGTIAADTARYPFGTIMYVPGYGYGRVEDRGGDIKGNRLDLYFRSHREALAWGRQRVKVKFWPE